MKKSICLALVLCFSFVAKADIDEDLIEAVQNNDVDAVLRCLGEEDVNVNLFVGGELGLSLLMIAAKKGFCNILFLLLEREDLDLEAKNYESFSAIVLAAIWKQEEAALMLAAAGACTKCINSRSNVGRKISKFLEIEEGDRSLWASRNGYDILATYCQYKQEVIPTQR